MKHLLAGSLAAFGLSGCQADESHNDEAAIVNSECHDCDGWEGLVQNVMIEAAEATKEACGGYVEPIEGKSGLSPSDYRCVR